MWETSERSNKGKKKEILKKRPSDVSTNSFTCRSLVYSTTDMIALYIVLVSCMAVTKSFRPKLETVPELYLMHLFGIAELVASTLQASRHNELRNRLVERDRCSTEGAFLRAQ